MKLSDRRFDQRHVPRVLYVVVFECGAYRAVRTAETAEEVAETGGDTCCARGPHEAKVVPFRPSPHLHLVK